MTWRVQSLRDRIALGGGLVTQADLHRLWGVSKATIHKIVNRTDFPEPVVVVGRSSVWLACECEAWRQQQNPLTGKEGGEED